MKKSTSILGALALALAGCTTTNPFDVTYSTQIVRGGLNYKF